jgi:phytoene dehydrogenase-like protein
MTVERDVVIVGAGLAGLTCALELERHGVSPLIVEASDAVGGRVRTDRLDGFLLDRGFQVILTAYPELSRYLDLSELDLRRFDSGALVWLNGKGHVVGDPFRAPTTLPATALAPIGSPVDKLRIAWLRHRAHRVEPRRLLRGQDISTAAALRAFGFSNTMIDRFLRPLFGGIQLDPDLATSRRMFDIIFRMLSDGSSAVPRTGMQALPETLARKLSPTTVRLNSPVERIDGTTVRLASGESITSRIVVVATDGPSASRLLDMPEVHSRQVGCVYFAADEAPTNKKMVILDGTGKGPVLNVAVMSNVAPTYAPRDQHLIVAALPGVIDGDIESLARTQLRGWWGSRVDTWRHLETYRIHHGGPVQAPPFSPKRSVAVGGGRFVCGDHRDTGSIQGAMYSGRRTATEVLSALAVGTP